MTEEATHDNTSAIRSAPNAVYDLLPIARMNSLADQLAQTYRDAAEPYPHVVVDDLFEPAILQRIVDEFPPRTVLEHWDTQNENKYTSDGDHGLSPLTRCFLYHLNSRTFVRFIEQITGVGALVADPEPGIHEVLRGGFLRVHVDYNKHPVTFLERRINLLLYLNDEWPPEYGGALELWDAKAERCVRSIEPRFNRMLIFPVSDTAYHGHPKPLACPPEMSRKALHVSYYSVERPETEVSLNASQFVRTEADSSLTAAKQSLKRWVPPAVLDLLRGH